MGHPEAAPDERSRVAAAVRDLQAQGRLDLPRPGGGRTAQRWAALAAIAREDLAVARLAEGHTDAVAILAELDGAAPGPGHLWGVWAAEPPQPVLRATRDGDTWRLDGTKPWCSGAHTCTHALVTARVDDGAGEVRQLFAVALQPPAPTEAVSAASGAAQSAPQPAVRPVADAWPAVGMAGSDSGPVRFVGALATPVGRPGQYVERPGFWAGGCGVAACWYGGAQGLADQLLATCRARVTAGQPDPHALAHLGAVDVALHAAATGLAAAAASIDADPTDAAGGGQVRAARVRAAVEAACDTTLAHVGRALGAGPHGTDAAYSRRVADLTVFLRQSHAERDLAALGAALAAGQEPGW